MATRKTPAKKTTAKKPVAAKTTAKRATTKRAATKKSTPRRRTTSRRPKPALSTTIGSALGALIVSTLLDLAWPVRIALIVGVLLIGLGYLLWKNRRVIAAEAATAASAGSAPEQPETGHPPL